VFRGTEAGKANSVHFLRRQKGPLPEQVVAEVDRLCAESPLDVVLDLLQPDFERIGVDPAEASPKLAPLALFGHPQVIQENEEIMLRWMGERQDPPQDLASPEEIIHLEASIRIVDGFA